LLAQAESASQEQGDNMSAIGLQWGDKQSSKLAVSTISMPMGSTTTIINQITHPNQQSLPDGSTEGDFTDDEIENTIAEIQRALLKTKRI